MAKIGMVQRDMAKAAGRQWLVEVLGRPVGVIVRIRVRSRVRIRLQFRRQA